MPTPNETVTEPEWWTPELYERRRAQFIFAEPCFLCGYVAFEVSEELMAQLGDEERRCLYKILADKHAQVCPWSKMSEYLGEQAVGRNGLAHP